MRVSVEEIEDSQVAKAFGSDYAEYQVTCTTDIDEDITLRAFLPKSEAVDDEYVVAAAFSRAERNSWMAEKLNIECEKLYNEYCADRGINSSDWINYQHFQEDLSYGSAWLKLREFPYAEAVAQAYEEKNILDGKKLDLPDIEVCK